MLPQDNIKLFQNWNSLCNHIPQCQLEDIDYIYPSYNTVLTHDFVGESLQNTKKLNIDLDIKLNKSDKLSYWLRKHTGSTTVEQAKNVIRVWQKKEGFFGLFKENNTSDNNLSITTCSEHTQKNVPNIINTGKSMEANSIAIIQYEILYLKNKYK
jgi:hypothetical protein